MWLGNFLIVMMVGWIALDTGASGFFGAHIVAIRVEAFSFLPGFELGTAVATLVGQYLGAGHPELARKALFRAMILGAGVMGLMGTAFVVLSTQITGVLTTVESHQTLIPPLLVICGVVQIPFGVALVIRSALRGAGDVKAVMWITWLTTYAIRLPLVYALSGVRIPMPVFGEPVQWIDNPFTSEPSLTGLWLGLCSELVIRGMIFLARFLHGGWSKAQV